MILRIHPCKPKISQLQLSLIVNKEIRAFYITVENLVRVTVVKPGE